MQRKVLGELLLRAILKQEHNIPAHEIKLAHSEKNKPFLKSHPHIHYNISHSGHWVVIAFSSKPVGIDIEKIRDINFGIARRYYSEQENQYLFSLAKKKQLDYFFDLWTLKESYLKAIGTGLTRSLQSFTIQNNSDGICVLEGDVKNNAFFGQVQFDRDYKLSVCTWDENINDDISVLYINDLLEMLQD